MKLQASALTHRESSQGWAMTYGGSGDSLSRKAVNLGLEMACCVFWGSLSPIDEGRSSPIDRRTGKADRGAFEEMIEGRSKK
jgi:hypothetical protein